jgi:hypothetical protein
LLGCSSAAVTGNDLPFVVNQDRAVKSEPRNTVGNLPDLGL